MNNQFQVPESVNTLKAAAQQAASSATSYAGGEASISDVLRQKVTEAYANNQDIVAPLDKATTTYLSAPATGREKYQNIFNPFSREKLVSQYVGTEALPMLSLSNIYGNRLGRIEDVLGAGVRGYQSASAVAQAKAESARQAYTDALSEWKMTQDLGQEQQRINKTGSGSAADDSPDPTMNALLEQAFGIDLNGDGVIGFGTSQDASAESMPAWRFDNPSSVVNKQGAPAHYSPAGEWKWDVLHKAWVPADAEEVVD